MPRLTVTLFGGLSVRSNGLDLAGFDAGKVQELFAYVLIHRGRSHLREALAGLLWGESSTAQSKKYLRQTLWQLQNALEPDGCGEHAPTLLIKPEWVRLNPDAELWLDVGAFEEAFAVANRVQSDALSDEHAALLEHAVDLYRGELLEGCYQDWCLFERERLQNAYLAMLEKLMDYCRTHGRYEAGIAYGDRILRYDRAREQTHRRLMVLAHLAGDRTSALRQFDRCAAALMEELGVRPSARTVALHERIRADRLEGQSLDAGSDVVLSGSPSTPDALVHLRSIWAALADAEHALKEHILALERSASSHH